MNFREKCSKTTLHRMELDILYVFHEYAHAAWEQKLVNGAQAMYIACNDTSVIVIHFRKSKTHAIIETYCKNLSHLRS